MYETKARQVVVPPWLVSAQSSSDDSIEELTTALALLRAECVLLDGPEGGQTITNGITVVGNGGPGIVTTGGEGEPGIESYGGTGGGAGGSFYGDTAGGGEGVAATGGTAAAGGIFTGGTGGKGVVGVASGDATAGDFTATDGYAVKASNDTSSPTRSALRLVPQDADPTGPNLVGDERTTTAGVKRICTVAGTPGTWADVGSGSDVGAAASILKHRDGDSSISTYYLAGGQTALSLTNNTITKDILRAFPLVCPEWGSATITELVMRAFGAGSGNGRLGLYRNAGEGNLYPGTLVEQSGDIDLTASGVKTFTLGTPATLSPGELVWIVETHSANRDVYTMPTTTTGRFCLGYEDISTLAPTLGHQVAQVYGTLPDPFPTAGRTKIANASTECPALWALFA